MEIPLFLVFLGVLSILILIKLYLDQKRQIDELMFKIRSQRVRFGKSWEELVPLMKSFPFESSRFKFLGDPIDGVVFEDDKITFVEIKSGKAQLNHKQKKIKNLVKEKKVFWKEFKQ